MKKKLKLEGLDCANCAYEIEEALKKEGLKAYVDFAGKQAVIEGDVEKAKRIIRRTEPTVRILEGDEGHDHGDEMNIRKELIFIFSSAALFVLGIIFRNELHNTPYSAGEYAVFMSSYLLSGGRILYSAGRNIRHGKVFDENFLMAVATIGAIIIHELPEAVGVMLFFQVGEFFQGISVNRSRRSIRALLEIRPDHANLKTDGKIITVPPENISPGDIIVVKPGEKIPLDGEVLEGRTQVDTSPLTGESVPVGVGPGDTVLAGSINGSGMITVMVTKSLEKSSIYRILELVENARSKKSETEQFITRFARYYTPAVVLGALAVAILPPLLIPGAGFSEWIYRALVLLVISCPCALVISIPLGYFGGVGRASHRGILVKGSKYLDALAELDTVVFDKTGTLTKGVFRVTKIVPENGFTEEELLSMAAAAESSSTHPIARSIIEAYGKEIDPETVKEYREISGHGIMARIDGREVIAGNDRLLHLRKIEHGACDVKGTVVHLAVDGNYAGYILISDEVKDDAKKAIEELRAMGIRTVMLTGDSEIAASLVAKELGVERYFAELLPEEKLDILEKLKEKAGKVAFVGDGINDAPVIARADVGIAMGGLGSEAAIETADVVIMTDAPSRVPEAIRTGQRTRHIVWENIGFAMGVKGIFIALGIVGMATMWEAVFADVGVALIAVFNALRILR